MSKLSYKKGKPKTPCPECRTLYPSKRQAKNCKNVYIDKNDKRMGTWCETIKSKYEEED